MADHRAEDGERVKRHAAQPADAAGLGGDGPVETDAKAIDEVAFPPAALNPPDIDTLNLRQLGGGLS